MQHLKTFIGAIVVCSMTASGFAQSVNWASLQSEQKHVVHVNAGWDYGLVFGAGYAYQVKSKISVLLHASYSFPSGRQLLDDFKTKIGGQVRVYRVGDFQFSASVYGIYRRYGNPLVRLQNFGSEMNAVIGYYRPKWFMAAEVGFDKAIVTHFKHSGLFKEMVYAGVEDGWYEPASGGNFNYGLQAGYSLKKCDFTFKIGKVITQDFKTTPMIPYYLQLGFNYKISGRKA